MKTLRTLSVLLVCAVIVAVCYWMFADTIRHHTGGTGKGPLRVSFWGGYEQYRMWKEMLASFRQKHPDIEVKAEYIISQYPDKIHQLLVADTAPDVMLLQDEPFPEFVNSGKFEELTGYLKTKDNEIDMASFWDTSVESFGRYERRDGKNSWHVYGIPIWGDDNLIYYNKDCFERAGVRVGKLPGPAGLTKNIEGEGWILDDERWNMDEFVQLCQILTLDEDGDGRKEQFGFILPNYVYWLPWHWSMGARILDEEKKHTAFLGPECEASLQLWQDLQYRYGVSPSSAKISTMGPGGHGKNMLFFTGRVALYSTGARRMPFFNVAKARYNILHIPRRSANGYRATRISWDALVMFKGSRKKKQAWQLISHLVSLDCQRIVAKYQRAIPARKSAGSFLDEFNPNPEVHVYKFVQAAVDYARVQPITREWSLMDWAWSEAFSELQNPDPEQRLTPAEAIGMFFSDEQLMEKFPPIDEAAAEHYRKIYQNRRRRM